MARKAIVDRNTVLQLLKEGKSSQTIGAQFGVSRQAIDLYRKDFIRIGLLPVASAGSAAVAPPLPVSSASLQTPPQVKTAAETKSITPPVTPREVSLDQMIDLLIRAFDAMRRVPEMEAEVEKYRRDHEGLLKRIEQLEERERKRKEQETRWIHAQNPDILTNK